MFLRLEAALTTAAVVLVSLVATVIPMPRPKPPPPITPQKPPEELVLTPFKVKQPEAVLQQSFSLKVDKITEELQTVDGDLQEIKRVIKARQAREARKRARVTRDGHTD